MKNALKIVCACLLTIAFTSCMDEDKEPDSMIDNSGNGQYNVKNCIVADPFNREQLYEKKMMQPARFEFDEHGCPLRMYTTTYNSDEETTVCTYDYPEGPKGSTVIITTDYASLTFKIGSNGFAKSCTERYHDGGGETFDCIFGYDTDGHLVYVKDDSGCQFVLEYSNGDLSAGYVYDNCGDLVRSCRYEYTDKANYGYMPYNLYSEFEDDNMSYEWVFSYLEHAYIAGLLGKQPKHLPDIQHISENGSESTYYFHHEYNEDPSIVYYLRYIPIAYGWDTNEESKYGKDRVRHPTTYTVEF